jgi:hypothetical protein
MSQVVTELVIDADTSGADQFSDAMDRTSASAQSGMGSVAGMSLAIAGVGVAVVAAIAGLRSFIDYAGQQSQQLVDLSDHAALAGVSVKELQETLFAARSAGVSDKDFFAGLDKISSDLVQANQGATEFGRLFEANGLKIKDQNGQLISTKQALADIMTLTENAAPAVQQRIAGIVGVSASWIPFLKEGADQFAAQKQAAEDLGVVIDDATIAKAQQFNAQWKQAVATWDLQFKASLASILPLLTQAATLASSILNGIGSVTGSIGRWLTPDEDKSKAQLNAQIDDAFRLRDALQQLGQIDQNSLSGIVKGRQTATLAGLLGLPEDATITQVDQLIDKLGKLYDGAGPARLNVTPSISSTVLPSTGSKDDIDRTTDAIERQIAKMQADAEAAGQGARSLEELRVEAQLYAAAERAGKTDLEQYADQFKNLAERAGLAAEQLAKAKVAADIKFGGNTAFLSQDDVTIASKLKDVYPDVTSALNSSEAAQLRFNSAVRGFTSTAENDLVNGLTDISMQQKSIGQGAADMATSFERAIEQMIWKITVVEPLLRSLQSLINSVGGLDFLGLGGSGVTSTGAIAGAIGPTSVGGLPLVASANGNIFSMAQVVPFANGGIPDVVGSPTIAPMAMFGEDGEEAIMPLRRGSDGRLGVAAGGAGGSTNVVIHNHTDAKPAVSRAPNGDVTVTLRRAMDSAAADSISNGAGRRALSQQFGLKPFTGQ